MPTVELSIDINPSIELGINCFNRIVSCESYNEDGEDLLDSLHIRFKKYSEAIDEIEKNERIQTLLENDGVMMITVVENENRQSKKIYAEIQSDMEGITNTHCYYAKKEEVEEAHDAGLSYGKYCAFQEVKKVNPEISVQEIEEMPMCEIRKLMEEETEENKAGVEENYPSRRESHDSKGKQKMSGHHGKHK